MASAAPIAGKISLANMSYNTVERGSLHSLDYRVFIKDSEGNLISPWHDVPLYADAAAKVFNMVVEIPRWTHAKMEMATKEPMNPIRQDEKKGLPRFVHNIFPHHGYIWNYGALPQTWEDPNHVDAHTGAKGDNDPIDVIEIGSKVHKRGAVVQVKVLGVLGLLDEGETDWKLVTIDVNDRLAQNLEDIVDVQKQMPGLLAATYEWFRDYKIPTGKPANRFAFNGQFKDRNFAHGIIEDTHKFWQAFIQQKGPTELNSECHVDGATNQADQQKWNTLFDQQPQPGPTLAPPDEVDGWIFLTANHDDDDE